ncbi:uncharacterized protein LOC144620084 [Crassostrea virginica]
MKPYDEEIPKGHEDSAWHILHGNEHGVLRRTIKRTMNGVEWIFMNICRIYRILGKTYKQSLEVMKNPQQQDNYRQNYWLFSSRTGKLLEDHQQDIYWRTISRTISWTSTEE